MRTIFVVLIGLISTLYLLNIGVGIIEFLPDNLPFIGNLDEAGATAILIMCIRYFGLDITKIFEKDSGAEKIIEV